MVGLWGASSLIKSIQQGTIAIGHGSTSNTATITSVDLANSFVVWGGWNYSNTSNTSDNFMANVVLTNATTVTAARVGSTFTVTVSYTVVEFVPGVTRSIQRGTITLGGGQASLTATITEVNTAKTFLSCGSNNDSSGANGDSAFGKLALTNGTTITASRAASTAGIIVAYSAVEFF